MGRLTGELAVANGELRRQYDEKEALSRRLSLLLGALPGGVVVLDSAGVLVEGNPAAIELFGGPVLNQPWTSVAAQYLVTTGTPQEWRLRRSDGALEQRWVSISASELDPAGGRVLLLSDVTDAYLMREQLDRHKKLSAMGEMAAGLAHQLRTPLATALLYTGNLARAQLSEADRQRFAEKALARLRDLERMIHDMLTFVRGAPTAREVVTLADLVHELTQVMEPLMAQQDVRLRVAVRSPNAVLSGNRKALSGAFLNLLENALQANTSGGEVSIDADVDGERVLIQVRDTGKGMLPEVQERLFQPFFTTRADGTGLGLAIVRTVIDTHGGEIAVCSSPGAGTTFSVRLPLHRVPEALV